MKTQSMKTLVIVVILGVLINVAIAYGRATDDDVADFMYQATLAGCTKVSADGTSSLHVSQRALDLARENGWRVESDDGLVCK